MATLKYKNGTTWTTVKAGANAGFAAPTATINNAVGTPGLTITSTGTDAAKKYNFAFTNCKGSTGAKGAAGDPGPDGNCLGVMTRYSSDSSTSGRTLVNSNTDTGTTPASMAVTLNAGGYNSAAAVPMINKTQGILLASTGYFSLNSHMYFVNGQVGYSQGVKIGIGEYLSSSTSSFPSSWTNVSFRCEASLWPITQTDFCITFEERLIRYTSYVLIGLLGRCSNRAGLQVSYGLMTSLTMKYYGS